MKRFAMLIVVCWISGPCFADGWRGDDKTKHLVLSIPAGTVGVVIANQFTPRHRFIAGTALGSLPGVIKEIYDSRSAGSGFSYKDATWSVAGAAVGSYLGHKLLLAPRISNQHVVGMQVGYQIEF